ncbi:MAG: aldo/keto reductase [Chloroflexi bacterium]|nr:aldo/keto reductase [Chloroflexota bacterium]MDE2651836.1 aldo/keto reductase [Chloroflexota bacterium]MXX82663.1 aldo/keto reductase [Chloroflexota bacterium]MYE78282.1 aldo/keto reductase [Chloroflexota bacterium]
MMQHKRLGRTELQLPILGIGTAFVGIPTQNQTVGEYAGAPSQVDQELGLATLLAAIDSGCAFFDTAALYGRGLSESLLGEALRQRPAAKDRLIITTKAGSSHAGYDFSYAGVQGSVYASLERMGLQRLPVVYIHDAMGKPMDFVLSQRGALGALRDLQRQGIIDHIGTAANDPSTNLAYIKTGEFDCAVIADSWSLINRIAEREIFAAAAAHDVGLVVATPLERGLLVTGPQAKTRYLNRIFSQACLHHVTRIQQLCADYAVPMLAVALQYCARHTQVASTIPGTRVPSEATSSLAAAQLPIPERLWEDLRPLLRHFDTAISV